ncbi:hypothetical protein D8674_040515 [Pyrus ussuriensis x Pyrus communis]|uniref:TMV resistance protein N-like n=1 Tax=Pyrus ussuriensis x Pyrus communis TaxID=2448454 RepID=A0A5N5FBS2_9ROSA|nr:hypothetical protein D8674_040515 [Pyrus ussuriensis x Pyrus communis]
MPLTPLVASLPELVKKFGQIKTKLQSPPHSSKSFPLQNVSHIFKDWMRRDFTASFNLKVLHDAKMALTELYKAQSLSKAQYEYFLNFFENMRALKDQYQKAEWASNRVKCYQEKHKGLAMEDKIAVVDAKKMNLANHLCKKIEEVEKMNQEVEDSKAQLANNNMYLEEPGRIFTIMQNYYFRMATLAKDVKLLN